MIHSVLQFADLQEICKPGKKPRLRTVESWLQENGVAYKYDAKGGCFTTVDAFNRAMKLTISAANDAAEYDPNEIF